VTKPCRKITKQPYHNELQTFPLIWAIAI